MNLEKILEELKANTTKLETEEELIKKLKADRPLRVKLGIDASGPEIHLGFAVVLRKLRQFQELGHTGVLIIGDFTGKIGDPSGRKKTRPQLSDEEIKRNIARYKEQVFKILLPEKTEFVYNSSWSEPLKSQDIINLASKITVARIIEREDFSSRLKTGSPVFLHEILYPLFQGYDSVAVKSDIELGGDDQYWNLLVARELQRAFNQEPQVIMTLPLLEGTDGKLKMSKSYGNYIGIGEPPKEIYGKVMSIPDESILRYFRLATTLPEEELKAIEKRLKAGKNPKEIKSQLAKEIVALYYSKRVAEEASEEFERVFKEKKAPEKVPEYSLKEPMRILELLVNTGLLASKSEARRKIGEGAVSLNGEKVRDPNFEVIADEPIILKVGKRRFLKIIP